MFIRVNTIKRIGVTAAVVAVAGGIASRTLRGQTIAADSNQSMIRSEFQKRGIVGYGDRLSVQQGETIKFMVSSELPRYRVDIVRMLMGDANDIGPGIRETVVETPVNREYPGKHQEVPFGSFVTVADAAALKLTGSFTIAAWIAPSLPGISGGVKSASGLVSKWSDVDQSGYGLMIDEDGSLAVWIGGAGGKPEKIRVQPAPRKWTSSIPGAFRARPQGVATTWYFAAATFDAATGTVALYQMAEGTAAADPTTVTVTRSVAARSLAANDAPLLLGAYWGGTPGARSVRGHFNGKIGAPRIYDRALTALEIQALRSGQPPGNPVAAWDFSQAMDSDRVVDASANKLNGRTVNAPMRAVTGANWTGEEIDYRRAQNQYNAIYFHDDDLDDTGWDPGFEYVVPRTLKSGLYAARLRTTTGEDYIPFFVRPARGTSTSKIALLFPTFSYLAYGATGSGTGGFRALSTYAYHNDFSGTLYSSRLRPLTNLRPKIATNNPWQFMADTHIVDWLDAKGFDVDVLTDEDVHAEGVELLRRYTVVMTGSHPEYTSKAMLDAFASYMNGGGRMMYMGGNGFYWITSYDKNGHTIEVRKRDGTEAWNGAPGEGIHSQTGEVGGLWRFRGLAPQKTFGVGFTAQGFDRNSPYRRMPGSFDPRAAFIFEGIGKDELIGNHPNLVLSFGAAGSELDRADFALGTPPHTLILATSFGHSDAYQQVVEEVNTADSKQGGTINPLVKADLVFAEYPNGGAVFSTGSIAWSGSLFFNNYNNSVSKVTENVLRRFVADAPIPFPSAPSRSSDSKQ